MNKYLAALLPGIIILFGGLQTALVDDRIDRVEGGQLLALVAGVVLTYVVPLVSGRWAGLLKTGAAILAAVATLIIPLIVGFSWQALVIFALAALSAVATEIGVQVRKAEDASAGTIASVDAAVAAAAVSPYAAQMKVTQVDPGDPASMHFTPEADLMELRIPRGEAMPVTRRDLRGD